MKWWKIENKKDKAEIWIYEEIGFDYWTGEGTTAKTFQKELSAITASQIDLHVNSPGGAVFDGLAIYNLLKQHPARITTYIDGIAASIASVIALAGDEIFMAENAIFMMHNPTGMAYGTSEDMRKMAEALDKVRGSLMTAYISRSGQTEEQIGALLDAETWMNAEEAKEAGFVDEITEMMDLAACAKFVPVMKDKWHFKNVPDILTGENKTPSVRDYERALRDVGASARLAKVILAKGLEGALRDEEPPPKDPPSPEPQRDVEPPVPAGMENWMDLCIEVDRFYSTQCAPTSTN